jgi:hypothetical protein
MFDWDLDFKLNMTWMLSEQQGERKPNKGRNLRNRRQLSVGAPGQVAVISEGSTSDCLSIIVTDEFMPGALLVLICSYENIITVHSLSLNMDQHANWDNTYELHFLTWRNFCFCKSDHMNKFTLIVLNESDNMD